jgi:polyisoprenyl-teichoic acid--peptidoglycan teichoic acid transferase
VTVSSILRPRSPRRRALTLLVLGPVLCGVLVAGAVTAAWVVLGKPVPAQGAVWFQVAKVGSARNDGGPQQPFFALVLGTGARSDDPSQSPDDPGLADAVHVIGVNPALKSATILDIPRDTEGPGGSKINSYIVNDPNGNELRDEANAVQSIVGVPISWVIRANFPHFQQMVDEIGGIDVNIPAAMDDDFSGAHFAAGPAHLNGEQALQFSRDRHSFANGDLTRTSDQGLLILSALQTIQAKHPSAGDTLHLIATLGRHTKLDGVGISDLFHMGSLSLTFDPANVKNVVLPVGAGSGSNLVKSADADSLLADFADDGVLQSH